jgi:Cu(I)/Ag(I) efflux system membrane fusion protein
VDGLILERHVSVGERFMRGESLYRIARLASVWVLADIHPGEATLTGTIRTAQIRVEGLPPLDGRISPVPPQFDERGRTGKLRLEVNNARGFLVPGMIVDVVLNYAPRSAITVPVDSVIDSGAKQYVYVALSDGRYELREVKTGSQERDRVEILSGLDVGERVVTAGAFLLDSESRLKNAAAEGKLTVRGAR